MSQRILLKVTGSISAYKSAYLASRLVQAGYSVRTVFSKSASYFVGAMTFEGLTGEKVLDSSFESGNAMAHIDYARWADLTLIYPASANTLNRLASGDGSDLIGALFLAHDFKTPYWIAPAMNPSMLTHPATRSSIEKLKSYVVQVLESASGRMACGEVGEGRLIEPEEMFSKIESHFKTKNPKRVLITAGGTSEPIDLVRSITNSSTGETGFKLALALTQRGHRVKLLLSQSSKYESSGLDTVRFSSCEDLRKKVHEELSQSEYDYAIHSAAVSDFSVGSIEDETGSPISKDEKISSDRNIRLFLKRNPKIVSEMKPVSKNKNLKHVSFKLTVGSDEFESKNYSSSDWIVQNEASRVVRGTDRHAGKILGRDPTSNAFVVLDQFESKSELFSHLERLIEIAPTPKQVRPDSKLRPAPEVQL